MYLIFIWFVNIFEYIINLQEGTSFVIDKIYILNVTTGTERLFATMKPFMSSSLINKVKYTYYLLLLKKLENNIILML